MTQFMLEDRRQQRRRMISLAVLVLLISMGAWISIRYVASGGSFDIGFDTITPVTLFLMAATGGLFFIPIPIEILYYTGVHAGSPPVFSTIAVIAGFTLGNLVSYLIGWKLSRLVMSVASAKKVYKVRGVAKKYGVYAIIGMNLVPAPSPVLTFGLGLTRYPFLRLFTALLLATIVKFMVILYVL